MKVTIQDKEIDLELTDEQKAAVERALGPNTGWERAALSDTYFAVDGRGFLNGFCEGNKVYDDQLFDNANYFTKTKLAMDITRAQLLQRKLWRRSAELCDKIGLNDRKCAYYISYNYDDKRFTIRNCIYLRHFGQVCFDTTEHAEQVLEEFRDELKWYFTEFKSRMD